MMVVDQFKEVFGLVAKCLIDAVGDDADFLVVDGSVLLAKGTSGEALVGWPEEFIVA